MFTYQFGALSGFAAYSDTIARDRLMRMLLETSTLIGPDQQPTAFAREPVVLFPAVGDPLFEHSANSLRESLVGTP
jgi:hypothetical protein